MYIDSLAESWRNLATQKYLLNEDETLLLQAIQEVIDDSSPTGVVQVIGMERKIKATRRQNVSYFKERGQPTPLKPLSEKYSCIRERVRDIPATVDESGSKIDRLIADVENGVYEEGSEEWQAVQELNAVRLVNPGKPTVEVQDIEPVERPPEPMEIKEEPPKVEPEPPPVRKDIPQCQQKPKKRQKQGKDSLFW